MKNKSNPERFFKEVLEKIKNCSGAGGSPSIVTNNLFSHVLERLKEVRPALKAGG